MKWTCPKCHTTFDVCQTYLDYIGGQEGFYNVRRCPIGCLIDAQLTFINSGYGTTVLRGSPDEAKAILAERTRKVMYMPKLDVKFEAYPDQVKDPGTYQITAVKGPQKTRVGEALIMLVKDAKGIVLSLFVPYSRESTTRTNLYRLIKGFGDNTDGWVGKRVKVSLGESNRRIIEPAQ